MSQQSEGMVFGGRQSLSGAPAAEKPNDVEIICLNKTLRQFGENIESKLKSLGLAVDVLFPNPDIPIGSVLGNIASRGVGYAVCLAPDNLQHRSVTLNVLQGEQQEHRNMPLEDAVAFIAKQLPSPGESPSTRLPGEVGRTLQFLLDSRPVSLLELDRVLRHLTTVRAGLLKEEYGDAVPAHLVQSPTSQLSPAARRQQEELRDRVTRLLDRGKQQQPQQAGLAPNLQAAIDSLVRSGPSLLSNSSAPPGQLPSNLPRHQPAPVPINFGNPNPIPAFQQGDGPVGPTGYRGGGGGGGGVANFGVRPGSYNNY